MSTHTKITNFFWLNIHGQLTHQQNSRILYDTILTFNTEKIYVLTEKVTIA